MVRSFVRGIIGIPCAAVVLLVLPGICRADSLSDARATVAKIKANIRQANTKIANQRDKIIATDLLIVVNEAAIAKAKKDGNQGDVIALRLVLVGLKAGRDNLVQEKQKWERFLQNEQKVLPGWEAEVKRLGG
jgi:hypothetical protein